MNREPATGSPDGEERRTTFDVRVWSLREVRHKNGSSWQVRWQVAGRPRANTRNFASKPAAESRRAEILTAVRKGEAFDVESGLPLSEWRALPRPAPVLPPVRTWLAVARDFADAKWAEHQAPGTRRTIATTLGIVTPALFDERPPAALADLVREALVGWVFLTGKRTTPGSDGRFVENEPPPRWAEVLAWMEAHSRPGAAPPTPTWCVPRWWRCRIGRTGNRPRRTRSARDACLQPGTDLRRRPRRPCANPLPGVQWTPPRKIISVDRRVVVDHPRALRLLAAVAEIRPDLQAWFACIYYAATRPGETNELNIDQLVLPETGWGEAALERNNPEISPHWSDEPDKPRQARQLKHREKGEVRPVPLHPDLVALLRRHIEEFGTTPDGRIFRSTTGGPVRMSTYLTVWRRAREQALTPAEAASPLARRPYDLRHAAVSRWLNAGVPPTQVAEWAGHSVRVLLTVYAKCIVGEEQRALRLIDASFAAELQDTQPPAATMATLDDAADHNRVRVEPTGSWPLPAAGGPDRPPDAPVLDPTSDLRADGWGL